MKNGSVEPGRVTILTTRIGHRFLIIGRDDQTEVSVTSKVLHQGFRFDPSGTKGIPAFYTQIEW